MRTVVLDSLETSSEPRVLTVKGSDTVTFNNVLVGDVWLAAQTLYSAHKFDF